MTQLHFQSVTGVTYAPSGIQSRIREKSHLSKGGCPLIRADLVQVGNPIGNFCDVWEARPLNFSVSTQVRGRRWQKLVMQTLEASLIVRFSPRDTLVTTDTDSTTVKVGAAGRIPG